MRILCAVAAGVGVLTAGCGGPSGVSAPGALAGVAPRQAVLDALQAAARTSLRYDLGGQAAIDSSSLKNVPPEIAGTITGAFGRSGSVTISGNVEQESAQRYTVLLSLKPLVPEPVSGVVYDGSFFYSLDSGTTYGTGGTLQSLTGVGITPDDAHTLLDPVGAGAFTDLGPTRMDGQSVEHYQVALTVNDVVGALTPSRPGSTPSSANQQNLQAIAQLLTLRKSTVDVYLTPGDARLERYGVTLDFGLDVARLANLFLGGATSGPNAASGSVNVTVDVSSHVRDVGAPIHVTRPAVSAGAPRLPSGLGGGILGAS